MKIVAYEDEIEARKLPGRDMKWLFSPDMGVSDRFSMNVVVLKPGSTVKPAHSHPGPEEIIYIVSGSGRVLIDDEVYALRAGTAVLFKAGSIHMVSNNGEEEMKIVCFFTPPATLDDYAYFEDVDFPDMKG